MTKLDQAIRQALSAEDAEFLAKFEKDAPLHEQVLSTFGGTFGAFNVLAALMTIAVVGAMFYCIWQFFGASDARDLIFWAASALMAAIFVAMVKIWFWMELHKNQVLREVKRLELQVARLAVRDAV
jgi:hypothetical protein